MYMSIDIYLPPQKKKASWPAALAPTRPHRSFRVFDVSTARRACRAA